jgi:hypothetical protein
MPFCKECDNVLYEITTNSEFYFKCLSCNQIYQPTDNDTLRYESDKGNNLSMFKTILQNCVKDAMTPKIRKDCIKCDNNILRQVRIGDEMKIINVCIECKHQWLET